MKGGFDQPERPALYWLANMDSGNRQNVSPKEIYDETSSDLFMITDIASARSVRNIHANPAVCVSLIDIFLQRGRKLESMAEIIAPDRSTFSTLAAPLLKKTGGAFRIRHLIFICIKYSSPILTPSYIFYPDRSETELCASNPIPVTNKAVADLDLLPNLKCIIGLEHRVNDPRPGKFLKELEKRGISRLDEEL